MTKNVKEALRVDKEAGNEYWEKEQHTELNKVKVAWKWVNRVTPDQARPGSVNEMIGHQ